MSQPGGAGADIPEMSESTITSSRILVKSSLNHFSGKEAAARRYNRYVSPRRGWPLILVSPEGPVAVEGLFSRPVFAGFGPYGLDPTSPPPPLYRLKGRRPGVLRAGVRAECPRRPGVYGMLDATGQLIYVGKARSLRARLLSYFRPNSRDAKAGRIIQQTRVLLWEFAPSEFAALLRELELIRRWRPRLNVQGQPHRHRHTYLCIGRRPAPYVFLSSRPAANILACFGPVPAGQRAREAVRRINDGFALRDCPQKQEMVFADQGELFPESRAAGCIRHEIGTCLGPCAAACTRAAYAARVADARAFLEGKDGTLLAGLARDMTAASAALAFERAAELRDRLQVLQWLHDHLERLRRVRDGQSFIYPVGGTEAGEVWYLIHQGRVAAARPAPSPETAARTAAMIEALYRRRLPPGAALAGNEVDGVLLVAAWFRKHPEERERVLSPEQALALCARSHG
jgi:excinuclease ABC subunit C